jgi:putative ABC transport system permease protein
VIKVAIKGLLGRKLRAVLTAFAIVLGVAMVSGTYVLTDTIKKGFDTIFTVSYKNADAVISGKTTFGNSNNTTAPSIPASVLTRVKALPGVLDAVGGVEYDETNLVDLERRGAEPRLQRQPARPALQPLVARPGPLAGGAG